MKKERYKRRDNFSMSQFIVFVTFWTIFKIHTNMWKKYSWKIFSLKLFFHSKKFTEQKQISSTEIYSNGKCWYIFSIWNHSVYLAQFFKDYYPGTFMSLAKSPLLLFYSIGGVSRENLHLDFYFKPLRGLDGRSHS